MRGTFIVLLGMATFGCSASSDSASPEPVATSAGSQSAASEPEPVLPTANASTNCEALALYLAQGGSSHDDLYDPVASVLYVYGLDGREYLLTPSDGKCIRNSTAVSNRIRDAVTAGGEDLEDSDLGALIPRR